MLIKFLLNVTITIYCLYRALHHIKIVGSCLSNRGSCKPVGHPGMDCSCSVTDGPCVALHHNKIVLGPASLTEAVVSQFGLSSIDRTTVVLQMGRRGEDTGGCGVDSKHYEESLRR